ncbi:MAG: glycosyltransferase [Acidimicrobiales bacterium]
MRVLCTCAPGYGHLHPMVPVARALQAAGHEVAFATERRFCRRAEQAGFIAFPAGVGPGPVLTHLQASPDDPWRFGAELFAALAERKRPDLTGIIGSWSPAVVVYEVTDFAGPVAAAEAGLPSVGHTLGPLFPGEFFRHSAEWAAPWGGPYLDICPPRLRPPAIGESDDGVQATQAVDGVQATQAVDGVQATQAGAHPIRPVPFDAVAGEGLPEWVDGLPDQPTVYVTLGTLDNDAPEVFGAVVAGLRGERVNVIVTVGPDGDPDDLGPAPPNVHVERYLPQSQLFPRCDAVVTHGGSGTLLAALAHGLPLLLLPQGANQFWNAERCAELGVGIRLLPGNVDALAVRASMQRLLSEPAYHAAAADLAEEIADMPPPEAAVAVVEDAAD